MSGFVYFECPACEWDCVLIRRESHVRLTCPLCAEDNGREVYLRSREAVEEDRPEGPDDREPAPNEARTMSTDRHALERWGYGPSARYQ